jgi:hypothetical protein
VTPRDLRYDVMREQYQTQRNRREQIRGSVATPVSAMAFTVFNLSTLAKNISFQSVTEPLGLLLLLLFIFSVVLLLIGATFIIMVEKGFIYVDPPDLRELIHAEEQLRGREERNGDEEVGEDMKDLLTGSYDIVYRWYFAANEKAARDRTRGLHLILLALVMIVLGYAILPFLG